MLALYTLISLTLPLFTTQISPKGENLIKSQMDKTIADMYCFALTQTYFKSNPKIIDSLRQSDEPTNRFAAVIALLFENCQKRAPSDHGLAGLQEAKGSKGMGASHLEIFQDLDVEAVIDRENAGLSEKEARLYQEFNELEEKIRKGQEKLQEERGGREDYSKGGESYWGKGVWGWVVGLAPLVVIAVIVGVGFRLISDHGKEGKKKKQGGPNEIEKTDKKNE